MTIRTESDIIRAANGALDLSRLVMDYLRMYKTYVNGSTVTIPSAHFYVTFPKQIQQDYLLVDIFWTQHDVSEQNSYTPIYSAENDPESDYFVEGFGGRETEYRVSTHTVHSESKETLSLRIPISHLLMPREKQIAYFTDMAAKLEAERVEAQRQAQIKEIDKRISELNAQKSVL